VTAQAVADLLHARPAGRGKWTARCPVHRDRSPSLSIREGEDGKTLIHCWAGCSTDDVARAAGLRMADLFAGPPPSPAQLAAIEAERMAKEQQRRAVRGIEREAWDKVGRWAAVVDALGRKLACLPDDAPEGDALTRTFHDACTHLHESETAALATSETRKAA